MRKVVGLHVGQLAKPLVLARPVRVKPPRVVTNALVGNLVGAQVIHLAIVRKERIQDGRPGNEVVVERTARDAHTATLRRAVHIDARKIEEPLLPHGTHHTAQDSYVLVESYVVEVFGLTVNASHQVPGHRGPQKAAHVLALAALPRIVHGDERTAHPRKGRLLKPRTRRPRISMELQHHRKSPRQRRPHVLGIDTSPAHANKPQVKILARLKRRNL